MIIFYPSCLLILKKLFYVNVTNNSSRKSHNNVNSNNNLLVNSFECDYLFSLLFILINPTLTLIDHGHFQYNCVSLGLMQMALYYILKTTTTSAASNNKNRPILKKRWLVLASFFFTLALNYKQMELYHALPFFFYLLGVCIKSDTYSIGFIRLVSIGLTVIVTFAILWLPFILNGLDLTLQVLQRLFPFSRGLFEDKVANFWCSISVLIKLKEKFSIETLSKISLIVTALLNLPSGLDLLFRPSRQRFMLSLVNSSLIFFLFSFQVHEKSILLATM